MSFPPAHITVKLAVSTSCSATCSGWSDMVHTSEGLCSCSQVSSALDVLDSTILSATEAGVSAKYAKKVLKRLQRQLDVILTPVRPSAEVVRSVPAAEIPEQEAGDPHPQAEQPHVNGSRNPVAQPTALPRVHVAENGIQQHARPGVKAPTAPMAQHQGPPPVRKAPPPGFVRASKQSPQQPLPGKPAWAPVKLPAVSAQPVVPPRSPAMAQAPMQPNGPVRGVPPMQQVGHCPLVDVLRACLCS